MKKLKQVQDDIEAVSFNKAMEVNSALKALKSNAGFDIYVDRLKELREGIKEGFAGIKATTIEEQGMKSLVLQAQFSLIESIINFSTNEYPEPEQIEGE